MLRNVFRIRYSVARTAPSAQALRLRDCNIILNSVRQHNYFITQGKYIGYMFRLQISHLQVYFCHLSHKMLCKLWDPIVFIPMEYIKLNHLSQTVWQMTSGLFLSFESQDAMHSLGSHRVYIHGIHKIKTINFINHQLKSQSHTTKINANTLKNCK